MRSAPKVGPLVLLFGCAAPVERIEPRLGPSAATPVEVSAPTRVDAEAPPGPSRPWADEPPPGPLDLPRSVAVASGSTFRLANGLRVVVVPQRRAGSVLTRLYFGQGSVEEPPAWRGSTSIAVGLLGEVHGGEERSPVERSSLRRKLFEQGAQYGFGVFHDEAYIQIRGYAKELDAHLARLSDAVIRPRRSEGMFRLYRSGLIGALESTEPEDPETFAALLVRAAFGPGHPYALSPLGEIDALAELEYETVVERQIQLLDPRRATLLVVGRVSVESVTRALETTFEKWRRPTRAVPKPRVVPTPLPPKSSEAVHVPLVAATLVTLCAARPLGDVTGNDEALDLLVRILGDGFGSRLHRDLREARGLAYASTARIAEARRARSLFVCTEVQKTESAGALEVLRGTIDALRTEPITEEELLRAKSLARAEHLRAQDDAAGAAEAWHRAILTGREPDMSALQRLDAVSLGAVRSLADEVMRAGAWRIVLAGEPVATARAAQANGVPLRSLTAASTRR